MIDALTIQLFGLFPREVANPQRVPCYSLEQFKYFLSYNEGLHDCYTSVYPFSGEVDKIFYDFDGHARGLEDARRVYSWLIENHFTAVPIASGKKGIHLYVLLMPHMYETPKELLTNASYYILQQVFGNDYLKSTADPHVIGDIRRITRIPNTRRPPDNTMWCVPLPQEFVASSWIDIINWCKMPHEFPRCTPSRKTLFDFPKVELPYMLLEADLPKFDMPKNVNYLLENMLSPCLYRGIMVSNPPHAIRVAATSELLMFLKPHQIADVYSKLGWVDYDFETTLSQIESCKKYRTFSCKKLRMIGACLFKERDECRVYTQIKNKENY